MTTTTALEPLIEEIRTPSRRATPDEIKQYKTEGYVLIPGLLSGAVVEELKDEVMEIMGVVGLGRTKLQQTWQYRKGSLLDHFVHGALQQRLASDLLGGEAILYLPFTAVKSGDGGGQFHFHQDNNYTHHFGPSINLWTALVPMTEENGCLRIVPRSHMLGDWDFENAGDGDNHRKVKADTSKAVPIPMAPGDVVAFTRLTVHGSGPNATPDHRVAYATQFHRADTEALVDGQRVVLKDRPRFTDIHGVDDLSTIAAGKRDGH